MSDHHNECHLPCFPDVGIIALVPDQWETPWMPRHQVLARLASYVNVVWVNPAHKWRQIGARWQARSSTGVRATAWPGLSTYTPEFWLPRLFRPAWLRDFLFRMTLARARSFLIGLGCRKIILYLWRPVFASALDLVGYDMSCYHIDDEYSFSDAELPVSESERRLIARVNHVFVHSPALLEKKGNINPHTTFVPNGVDYKMYAEPAPEPYDLASVPRPRIGYTGSIKRHLDWPLLAQLTSQHSEWSFVFVGPRSPHPEIECYIEELSARKNVYFLGCKSVGDLTSYPQHFDVCIMPYRMDDYTKYIYPLKLHEYLASGRPVVGTPIRSLLDFAHIVKLARTTSDWSNALADSLKPAACSDEQLQARRSVASNFDWDRLVAPIAQTICERLGSGYSEQFRQIHQDTAGVSGCFVERGT